MADNQPAIRATPTMALLRRLATGYLRPHGRTIGWALLLMVLAGAMTGGMASLMEPIIDGIFAGHDRRLIIEVALMVLAAFAIRGFSTYGHSVLMNRVGQEMVAMLQRQLHRHLLHADLAFFQAHASGGLVSRLVQDVAVMRQAMAECITSIGKSLLTLMILVGVMFYQDWALASVTLLVFPAAAWFLARIGKRLRRISGNTQEMLGQFSSQLGQTFQNARHVKAYGLEAQEEQRAGNMIDRLLHLALKSFRISASTTPVTEILSGAAIAGVIVYGGLQVADGTRTAGAIFSFITAFLLAYEPMKRLAKLNTQLQIGLGAAERVFAMLDRPATVIDRPAAQTLQVQDTTIRFAQVRFEYADGTVALDGIDLLVPHGRTVAIVGPSGAGKSTILNLIPRFYDVTAGRITIGGIDIAGVELSSLRRLLALVSQEVGLFDETIRANVLMGAPDADEGRLLRALRLAQADGFIAEQPHGLETIIGEQGARLSGGQRQRLAIARAMLRDAPILLLDEATSALDSDSERAVQAALRELRHGRTTLIVAHRLSSVVDADLIYVLEQGRICESGTHAELLARRGVYFRLYGEQAAA